MKKKKDEHPTPEPISGVKAFGPDWKCLDMQY